VHLTHEEDARAKCYSSALSLKSPAKQQKYLFMNQPCNGIESNSFAQLYAGRYALSYVNTLISIKVTLLQLCHG
jgi:hypothetical protein